MQVEEDDLLIAEYGYDPFGRRLWKEVDSVRTYFLYSDEGLVAEYDEEGNEIRSYGYKPDSTWTTDPLWLKEGGSYYWYQNDHLGTPQKLVDSNGTVVWSAQYTAFGEAVVDVSAVTNNLRFPGQYADAETELHYNWHRYYEPGLGRYLRTDPIGFAGGIHLYAYVGNNSINFIDPLGLQVGLTPFHWGVIKFESWIEHWGNFYGYIRDIRARAQQLWGTDQSKDAMKHCVVSCMVGSKYNVMAGFAAGLGNEIQGLVMFDIPLTFFAMSSLGSEQQQALGGGRFAGIVPWAFQLHDFTNNQLGFHCVEEREYGKDLELFCTTCCKSKIAAYQSRTWVDNYLIPMTYSGMPIGVP